MKDQQTMQDASEFFEDFLLPVLRIFNGFQGPSGESLFWRTDEEYAPLSLFVNCNDLFWWATADNEDLTPNDLLLLQLTVTDLQVLNPDSTYQEADILFCCRKRQMRPQRPYYKYIDPILHGIFDACGPERKE